MKMGVLLQKPGMRNKKMELEARKNTWRESTNDRRID